MDDSKILNEISRMKVEDFKVIYDYIQDLQAVNPQLKELLKKGGDTKGLAGIGALLIAIPDPFTDIPGVVLLLLVKLIEKNKGASVDEIYKTFNEELDSIKYFFQ